MRLRYAYFLREKVGYRNVTKDEFIQKCFSKHEEKARKVAAELLRHELYIACCHKCRDIVHNDRHGTYVEIEVHRIISKIYFRYDAQTDICEVLL